MTFSEAIEDAEVDVQAFGAFANLTLQNTIRFVSEALHELQKKAKVVKSEVTVETTALDANGTVELNRSITVPTRVTYTGTGSTQPTPVELTSPDQIAEWKVGHRRPQRRLYMAIERNRCIFWPFAGLSGTFTLTAYAKMPVFTFSRADDTTSYWYGWTEANLKAKADATLIPAEFDDAEEAIVAYVAARMLQSIPGWKQRFFEDYRERMNRFQNAVADIEVNQPTYPLSHQPVADYGW